MYDFTGCECPVCHQIFRPDDDMVVCPECGAPYHRACYEKAGSCVYAARHGAAFEWTPPQRAQAPADERACPSCGAQNPAGNRFCASCGAPLDGSAPARDARGTRPEAGAGFDYSRIYNATYTPPAGSAFDGAFALSIDPNETMEGISAADWAAYIGPASRVYLMIFKQMELLRRKVSFSFSALLFGPFYFFYRKAWKPGLIFAALSAVISVPSLLYMLKLTESSLTAGMDLTVISAMCTVAAALNFGVLLVRGLYGFYFYKKDAAERIRRISAECTDARQRTFMLSAQGGTSIGAVLGLGAVVFASSFLFQFLCGPNVSAMLSAFGF